MKAIRGQRDLKSGWRGVSVIHDEEPPHGPRRERLDTVLLIASGPPISLWLIVLFLEVETSVLAFSHCSKLWCLPGLVIWEKALKRERKIGKESNREDRKRPWRCTGRGSGIFWQSLTGVHTASMASGVYSGLKSEPRAREGPNEHQGSFITNQRNREAAMNISAFCSSSGTV